VTTSGPGVLDISVWERDDSLSVHLVNLTNPMMMKGPLREFFPVGPQRVALRLPDGRTPRDVRLLVSRVDVNRNVSGQTLSLTIPSITDHEVVVVEL
jgi:hypothetical protein